MIDADEDGERDALRREIRADGARIAFNALKSVCQDPKAPAQAKATAGTTILRAAGLFEKREENDEADPHSWSAAKLTSEIARLEGQLKGSKRKKDAAGIDSESDGVFD